MRNFGVKQALQVLSVVLALSALALGQTTTATLSGTLTDQSGGALPGVQVSIMNRGTGVQRTVTSDGAGRFTAPQLAPGLYDVTATMAGFETLVRQGITLAIGQEANLPLSMKVGAVTEQVVVTGEAPLLDTSTSAVGAVVEEKRIQELPLNEIGRASCRERV